jgi:pyruvate/2-oxoglutarate dehydrogenase complex dihydrolipoamide acyltransferase (E2) component|tara:strand:- start:35 stop:379 length:345 start_codon:yes stop_codon:yes gene_type:complete
MKKFLYFATGAGANLTKEAYVAEADMIASIVPVTTTTTAVYFNKTDETKDKIVFTHDNTTDTTGHRCKDIGKALAEAANAGPHVNGMTDVVDLDNSIFYGNLSFVTALAVTLDV